MDSDPINVSYITAYDADYISQYLMQSRNPDMGIEETLRRYRDEQNAKPRRKGPKQHRQQRHREKPRPPSVETFFETFFSVNLCFSA